MSVELALLVAAAGLIVTLLFAGGTARLTAGLEIVPTHFNIAGNADGFGPRWVSIALIPSIQAVLCSVLLFLPLLDLPTDGDARHGAIIAQASVALGFVSAQVAVYLLMRRWKRQS